MSLRLTETLSLSVHRESHATAELLNSRRQWGTQLIAVRNLARVLSALKVPEDDRRALIRLSVAHTHATRAQLRMAWRAGRDGSWVCCCCRRTGAGALINDVDLNHERDAHLEPAEKEAVRNLKNPADGILGLAATRLGAVHKAEGSSLDSYSVRTKSAVFGLFSG